MIDPDLHALASAQGGLFRRADAQRLGVQDFELARWVSGGLCHVVVRGVYSIESRPPLPSDRLLEKTRAMLLGNPHVAAAGRSALALHNIATYGVNYERAQGIWLNKCATRSTTDMIIRRPLIAPDVTEIGGHRVVEPAWAVVDVARDAGVTAGVVAADSALHQELATAEDLARVVAAHRRCTRVGRAVSAIALADGRSESPGETRLRLILQAAGIEVEPQFVVYDGDRQVARVDLRVMGSRLLIEFDGMVKYRADDGALVLEKEKRREDVVRRLGWTFERFVHDDFAHPRAIVARVRTAAHDVAA